MTIKLLAWDVETRPHLGWHFGLRDQQFGLNQVKEWGHMFSFSARWIGRPKNSIVFASDYHDGHQVMLDTLWQLIDEADALVSWNGASFDTKKANTEFFMAGMEEPSKVREIDLLRTARAKFSFGSNKLEHWATQVLGTGKLPHTGFDLWKGCMEDDPKSWATMKKYNQMDTHLLIDLYERMKAWVPNHPNSQLYLDNPTTDRCPVCTSDNRKLNGTDQRIGGRYQMYRCLDCGKCYTSGSMIPGTSQRGMTR